MLISTLCYRCIILELILVAAWFKWIEWYLLIYLCHWNLPRRKEEEGIITRKKGILIHSSFSCHCLVLDWLVIDGYTQGVDFSWRKRENIMGWYQWSMLSHHTAGINIIYIWKNVNYYEEGNWIWSLFWSWSSFNIFGMYSFYYYDYSHNYIIILILILFSILIII